MQLGTIEDWELWHEVETHTKYWFKDIRLVKDVLKTFVTACECRNSGNPQAQLWGNRMRAWTRRVLRDFLKTNDIHAACHRAGEQPGWDDE